MENHLIIFICICVSLSISFLLKSILSHVSQTKKPTQKQPPSPHTFLIIGNLLRTFKSFAELERVLLSFHAKLGPIITIPFGSHPHVFIADHSLAHQALVQKGAIFSGRPPSHDGTNQNYISTAFYGHTWRILRRNLTAEVLHPSRVKSYSHARKWVLQNLLELLKSQSRYGDPVHVMDHFLHSMLSLLALMCFGDKLEENQIKDIMAALRRVLMSFTRTSLLNICPTFTRIIFRKQWEELLQAREHLEDVLIPIAHSR